MMARAKQPKQLTHKNDAAKLKWTQIDKQEWTAPDPGMVLPARIRRLDAKTHACYRQGKYLGSEATLQLAQERCELNAISEKNRVMALWEKAHPDELPPGLQLTDAERAEYWRHHAATTPRPAEQPARRRVGGDAGNDADAGTRRLRAELARGGEEDLTVKLVGLPGKIKVTSGRKVEAVKNRDAEVAALLKRGCTAEEVLRVTGWKAVSMPAMAKRLGLVLEVDRGRKPFRYTGKEEK